MKKILLLSLCIFLLTGCLSKQIKKSDEYTSQMEEKRIENRFIIKELILVKYPSTYNDIPLNGSIIVDTKTGVNYIQISDTHKYGITPLIDKNGNIVIDKVGE